MNDIAFMNVAIEQAKQALNLNEVPIGCVIVKDNNIIAKAYNTRETDKNAVAHAEIIAISRACTTLCAWRLLGCTLYVTLEPCPMCMGAIINSRIERVVYGAFDFKAGCCGSVIDLTALPFNHKPMIVAGVLQQDCQLLLSQFFQKLRNNKNNADL